MNKTAVFFGSDSGSTKKVAVMIAEQLAAPCIDIADADVEDFEQYDLVVLGTPTVNNGEVQSDWDYVLDEIEDLDLSDTKVALFGLGDQVEYAGTFVDAIADLAEACSDAGATLVGQWSTEGYRHSESRAEQDGQFIGLAIDMERQPELTPARINQWVTEIKL